MVAMNVPHSYVSVDSSIDFCREYGLVLANFTEVNMHVCDSQKAVGDVSFIEVSSTDMKSQYTHRRKAHSAKSRLYLPVIPVTKQFSPRFITRS